MAERNTPRMDGELLAFLVAAATLIEAGTLVAVNASGYLVPAGDTAGLTVVGVADETVDNTAGSAGDLRAPVRRRASFLLENSGTNAVTQALVGKSVYVEDAVTVCTDAVTNDIVAGKCLSVSAEGVLVEVA